LFNRGRPVLFEVGSESEQKVLVERPSRSLQGTARVSRVPRSEFAVDALGDVVRIGLGVYGHRGVLCLLRAWRITDWGVIQLEGIAPKLGNAGCVSRASYSRQARCRSVDPTGRARPRGARC